MVQVRRTVGLFSACQSRYSHLRDRRRSRSRAYCTACSRKWFAYTAVYETKELLQKVVDIYCMRDKETGDNHWWIELGLFASYTGLVKHFLNKW